MSHTPFINVKRVITKMFANSLGIVKYVFINICNVESSYYYLVISAKTSPVFVRVNNMIYGVESNNILA